jgi:two-component system sensor histidine kinase TctE
VDARRRQARRPYSLRGRLLLWMLMPLLLVLSCSGVIAYYQAVYYAHSEYDQTLYDHVHSLAQLVEKHGKRVSLNMPRQAKRVFLWDDFDTTYYQISTASRLVAGEKAFPPPEGRVLKYYDTLIYDGDFQGHAGAGGGFWWPIIPSWGRRCGSRWRRPSTAAKN